MLNKKAKNGVVLVFLGPDGAGKTSIIERLQTGVEGYASVDYFHLKPTIGNSSKKSKPSVLDPHGKPRRGVFMSVCKLIYFVFVYNLGFISNIKNKVSNGSVVIFDRYFYDIIVDPKRYRVGLPAGIVVLLARLIPKPDLLFVIDAPTEVIQSRVREVPSAETERQRIAYSELSQRYVFCKKIDASKSIEDSVEQVMTHLKGI